MSKSTNSPDYQQLIISVSKKQRVGKMGNEWGKNPQKNGDSIPDNFHFPQE